MLLVILYILSFLSQYNLCTEIEDSGLEDNNVVSADESVADAVVLETSHILEEETRNEVETEENASDENVYSDEVSNSGINFAGPVQAKGTVSVGATFGYDSPLSPIAFPPLYPNYFYPTPYSPFSPFTFTHVPLISMFLQEGSPEHQYLERLFDDQGIFLEITPLNLGEFLPAATNIANIDSGESEDFPDFDGEDDEDGDDEGPSNDDEETNYTETPIGNGGIVFGGLIPASGTVTVAAKF